MPVQIVHARLSQRDAEELFACLKKMDAIHDSVKGASMSGKPSVIAHCEEVFHAIENVLRKELAAGARFKQRCEAEQGGVAPKDLSVSAVTANDPGAANQGVASVTAASSEADPGLTVSDIVSQRDT